MTVLVKVKAHTKSVANSLFCECCGKRESYLIKKCLEKGKNVQNGGKEYKGHTYYAERNNLYGKSCHCDYCRNCGEALSDENMHSEFESRGDYWGAGCSEEMLLGYTCSNCGEKVEF